MFSHKEKLFLLSLCMFVFSMCAFSQTTYKDFNQREYAPGLYKIKTQSASFDKFTVKLIKVFNKNDIHENAFYCRAWIKVTMNNKITDSLYFDNMVAGKGCSGLYMDDEQPSPHYFILVKYGDYNGRTLIIDRTGKIHNMIGGKYFITRDKRYLFSVYESDLSGLAVYDFKTNKAVFHSDTLYTKLNQWYNQDGRYFSLDQEDDEEEIETENPMFSAMFFKIKYFDFVKKQLKNDKLNFENLREENAIALQPRFKRAPDCLCK